MRTEVHSGIYFSLTQPVASEVTLKDIAHHLGQICRFGGATCSFYSVAEHSMNVSSLLATRGASPRVQLAGLLHDAHETYVGDVTTPVKKMFGRKYQEIVKSLDLAICEKFGLTFEELHSEDVKKADQTMLAVEAYYMMTSGGEGQFWDELPAVDLVTRSLFRPQMWSPETAKDLFIENYNALISRLLMTPGGTVATHVA